MCKSFIGIGKSLFSFLCSVTLPTLILGALVCISTTLLFWDGAPADAALLEDVRVASSPLDVQKANDKPVADTQPKTIVLDNKSYTKVDLITAFMQVAFNAYIHAQYKFPRLAYVPPYLDDKEETDNPVRSPVGYKKHYPWLYEYLYREQGMPRYMAINKWVKPRVLISTGFPNDLKPLSPEAFNNKNEMDFGLYEPSVGTSPLSHELEMEIKSTAGLISRATDIEFTYMPHALETVDNYADMRIVFFESLNFWESSFKKGVHSDSVFVTVGGSPFKLQFRNYLEPHLISTAVVYTPENLLQVDGYILSNKHNEIEKSFCFIWRGHEKEIIVSLLRECMVRSLGLTETFSIFEAESSLLSSWNQPTKERLTMPRAVSEIDVAFIELLYSAVVKPGMSAADVARLLYNKQSGKK
jgi:hypothetical protein